MNEFHNLGFTLRYNFHTEMFKVFCMKCNEEVLDTTKLTGKTGEAMFCSLDFHIRKCYPAVNDL